MVIELPKQRIHPGPPDSPERAAAKAKARQAVAEARRKIAYQPEQLPEPRRIQEPEQQETPA